MTPSVVSCSSCGTRNRIPAAASGSPRCAQYKQPLAWVVDDAPSLQARFGVWGIPTLVLLRHGKGKEVARQVGAAPMAQLRAWLRAIE